MSIIGVSSIAIGTFLFKKKNMIFFKFFQVMTFLFKSAICIILLVLFLRFGKFVYYYSLIYLKGYIHLADLYWEKGAEWKHLLAYCIAGVLLIPIYTVTCSIIFSKSLLYVKSFINSFLPDNRKINLDKYVQQKLFQVTKAIYGTDSAETDVTDVLRNMIYKNHINIIASNLLGGDPHPGILKKLYVKYEYDGIEKEITINEGQPLNIPEDNILNL